MIGVPGDIAWPYSDQTSRTFWQKSGKSNELDLKDCQELHDKIQTAVDCHDAHQFRESSHSLNSRSTTLGAMKVAETRKELETRTRTHHMMNEAPKPASDLQEVFAACDVLQAELLKRAA